MTDASDQTTILELPRVGAVPTASGRLRTCPEDFQVDEVLGFEPDGEGEHALLHVRKRNTNTDWLARQLAKHAGVRAADVSYSGQKDRAAVTTQWFSVHLPGRPDPDWSALASDDVEFLHIGRHARKLRRGSHRANRFVITVRELEGDAAGLEPVLQRIAADGVPNYFGEQRFGRGGGNLERAEALFAGELKRVDRQQRSMYISAARSHLFNAVLARRVTDGVWNRAVDGDMMMLDGSQSVFAVETVDADIERRVREMDIHPTGPMWGRGTNPATGACRALEDEVLAPWSTLRDGLEHVGLKQERRALRLPVAGLSWEFPDAGSLRLCFTLPRGAFATVVLREVVDYRV